MRLTSYLKTICAVCALMSASVAYACTNFIVGRKASADGSVFVTYSADSYGCYGVMKHFPAGKHAKGTMRRVCNWESEKFQGEIEEAEVTYNVVGNTNEHQLTIAETTFGGREELVNPEGILDYGSLIYITLQRARTAREAIDVMTSLVEKYGYNSEGETFSIADPNEAWIMEMVGKGPGKRGAFWVAVRIPDDCVAAHANQSRIHKFSQYPKSDCLYAKGMPEFAREHGFFTGKDADFDFANAFCPLDFSGARFCEARAWSFYNKWVDGMEQYLDYAMGKNLSAEPFPLYMKPKRKLSLADVEASMRDQYEGTPMTTNDDAGMGTFLSPYRPRPLQWDYDGKSYFNERPIATQQASFVFVSQMRAWLPNAIGGVLWFGNDDPKMIAFTPVYCCSTYAPDCYTKEHGDDVTFSLKSAFWVCNWVSNMVYPRYALLMPDVEKLRDALETQYIGQQTSIETKAAELYKTSPQSCVEFLTKYSDDMAHDMLNQWTELATRLIVKYNDFVIKPEENGKFKRTPEGIGAPVKAVGFPEAARARIVKETGDQFLVPCKK